MFSPAGEATVPVRIPGSAPQIALVNATLVSSIKATAAAAAVRGARRMLFMADLQDGFNATDWCSVSLIRITPSVSSSARMTMISRRNMKSKKRKRALPPRCRE